MTPKRTILAFTVLISLVGLNFGQKPVSADRLSWLSGCWEGRESDAVIEEHWLKPAAQLMLGMSRTVKNGKTVSFEFMQIRENVEGLAYIAQPQGRPGVSFKLAEHAEEKYVFENSAHDFPQRIIYEQRGKGLFMASIEATVKGKLERQEFLMRRVRCDIPTTENK